MSSDKQNINLTLDNFKYKNNNYDNNTLNYYYNLRKNKKDPLFNEIIPKHLRFKFYYEWDPFTGIRLNKDKNGPLYFNALTLYEFYFINRYRGLWIDNDIISDVNNYYGEMIGHGKNINNLKDRHKYLFRIPIMDCYIPAVNNDNFNIKTTLSLVTFGPILTDSEIAQIDEIVLESDNTKTPLSVLKKLYDGALDDLPDISKYVKIHPNLKYEEYVYMYNIQCVNNLVSLKK